MRRRKPHLLFLLAIGLSMEVAFFQGTALALGSSSSHDEPWNPDHVDRLPPDIRNAVLHSCRGRIQAAHYFATYLDHARTVRLHFENLRCDGELRFKRGDSCLHQEFVAIGARHRLAKRYYAPWDD